MLKVFCYMTIPSLAFPPSATLLSSAKIDVTASNGIFKSPVVPLEPNYHGQVLDSPVGIHTQLQ